MSFLLKKSGSNLKVASATHADSVLCPPSIHCSYYSCFQLVKYILANKLSSSVILPYQGVHQAARKEMVNALGFHNAPLAPAFQNDYGELVDRREEADYDDLDVSVPDAGKAYNLTLKIQGYLKKTFNVP